MSICGVGGVSLQRSSPKASAPDSKLKQCHQSPQLENVIFLMKFQVAAWQFPHQSCVGIEQHSLGP